MLSGCGGGDIESGTGEDALVSEQCKLAPDTGPCRAAHKRYYFDADEGCKEFIYGGCRGVVPFETKEGCEKECEIKK